MTDKTPLPPDPRGAHTLDELTVCLEQTRHWGGSFSYRYLADLVNARRNRRTPRGAHVKTISKSTVGRVMKGKVGSWKYDDVLDLLKVMKVPDDVLSWWRQAWVSVFGAHDPASIVEVLNVLPQGTTDYEDRSSLTSQILGQAAAGGVIALVGMPGVGKTQLAVHCARNLVRDGRFDDLQLYVDLRGFDGEDRPPADPGAVLDQLLHQLGAHGQRPGSLEVKIRSYRNLIHQRNAVLLLDNAANVEQIVDLLPQSAATLTIVTSRVALPGLKSFTVEPLERRESISLLRRTAELDPGDKTQTDDLSKIAGRCGDLPQALAVIGRHIKSHPEWTLDDHVKALTDLVLEGGVDAALTLSHNGLAAPQQRLLRLLSVSPCDDGTAHASAALADVDLATAAGLLASLVDAHLVQPVTSERHKLHDLVRAHARRRALTADPDSLRTAALERLAAHYALGATAAMDLLVPHEKSRRPRLAVTGAVDPDLTDAEEARRWLDRERSNLLVMAGYVANQGNLDWTSDLAAVLSRYLEIGAHYADAAALHELAAHSSDARRRCVALLHLAVVNFRRADYAVARDKCLEALDLALVLEDGTLLARVHINLGNVYGMLADYSSALDHQQRGYDLTVSSGSGTAGDSANALTNIGHLLERLGRYREAVERSRAALTLYLQIPDPFGASIAETNLGTVHHRLGNYSEALAHHERALQASGESHDPQGEALAWTNIAQALIATGELDRAEDALHEASRIIADVHDPMGQAYIVHRRALLHQARGNNTAALADNATALQAYRDAGEQQGEAEALNIRGDLLFSAKDHPAATEHYAQALQLARGLGDRYEQQHALRGLAEISTDLGRNPEADAYQSQANSIRRALDLAPEDSIADRSHHPAE